MIFSFGHAHFSFFLCNFCGIIRVALPLLNINLDIVTPGLQGESSASTITLAGPAFDVGIDKLRRKLTNFNITHTYLFDEDILDCVTFQDRVQNILSKWYYRERQENNVVIIMLPGKKDRLFIVTWRLNPVSQNFFNRKETK
jgi:hypothetical protein